MAAFKQDGKKIAEETLTLEEKTMTWALEGLETQPLLSLNRGFGAPIRLDHPVSDAIKLAAAKVDDDPFTKWDTLQELLKADLLAIAYQGKAAADAELIQAVTNAADMHSDDPAYAALLLRLPGIGELFLDHSPADPSALDGARRQIEQALAEALHPVMSEVLEAKSPAPFNPGAQQSGIRAWRTMMMSLLGALGTSDAAGKLHILFEQASNMTESLAALRALARTASPERAAALQAFETRWSGNDLVMDKWFGVQAAFGSVEETEALMSHKAFSLTNPNRVRSVIGVFAGQNLAVFHQADGKGYQLVTEAIAKADKANPALAARLLTTFKQWRSLTPDLQDNAKQALERLRQNKLSENVADIITRTLA